MINFAALMPKFNFIGYVSKIDPAFARALELGLYLAISYVALGFLQGSFSFDLQTIGAIIVAPTLALVAKRKRDLEKDLENFKAELVAAEEKKVSDGLK